MRVGLATPEIRGQLLVSAASSCEDNDTPVNAKELRNRQKPAQLVLDRPILAVSQHFSPHGIQFADNFPAPLDFQQLQDFPALGTLAGFDERRFKV
jgi:hypothetical protein